MSAHVTTAVVVNHNGGSLLGAALDGLARQAVSRIVVVDNASADGSADGLDRPDVELIRSETNLGFAGGVELALTRVATGFVLLLNADVDLGEDYVQRLAAALAGDRSLAGVTGLLSLPGGTIDSSGIDLTTARWGADRDRGRTEPSVGQPFGVSGAAALFRREALASSLWTDLFMYWEDIELAWRLRRLGWRFALVPEAQAVHQRGADSADPTFVEAASFGGRLATIARHEGVAGLVRPGSLVVTVLTAARLAARHPRALASAHALRQVRRGLHHHARDRAGGLPGPRDLPFTPHPWRPWLVAQLSGRRRGFGALPDATPRLLDSGNRQEQS